MIHTATNGNSKTTFPPRVFFLSQKCTQKKEANPNCVMGTFKQHGAQRGWGQEGEMTQALYAHMNNKTIIKKKKTAWCHTRPRVL
jgi:hypothetical protein